jgi:hypothetical protein
VERREGNGGIAAIARHVCLAVFAVLMPAPSTAKEREEQAEHDADDDAGDDGKIERGISTLETNVAREFSHPIAETKREDKADDNDHDSDDDDNFSQGLHGEWCHEFIKPSSRAESRNPDAKS